MRADDKAMALAWVDGLNKARAEELEKVTNGRPARDAGGCCGCFGSKKAPEREPLNAY